MDKCVEAMGFRADKVPLNRIRWNIVPKQFAGQNLDLDASDPELPHLRRIFADCHVSVFGTETGEKPDRFAKEIAKNARLVPCSVRMFILANMVAQREHEKTVIQHTEKGRASAFRAKMLTTQLAVKRASTYQEMCNDEFGTFSLKSLCVLTGEDEPEDIESTMLRSEITAGQFFVRYKIFNGGDGLEALYNSEELQLAPEWLAIEQTYIDTILKPYSERKIKGTDAVELHRFNARQVHGHLKKHLSTQRLFWLAREKIMPQAVQHVLSKFRHKPDDFLYPREPETDPMRFWLRLALTIRQYHCWLYLNDEPSFFTPRRVDSSPLSS